jgi:inosine-uridine nucleoside N-ribohydrolase
MDKHKIILDIDNAFTLPAQDTDDAMALALALTSPEIELIGCTTCAGNCRTWQSTKNTLRMLELAGKANIPVAGGREYPILQSVEASFAYLEAKTAGRERVYWESVGVAPEPTFKASPLKAHDFILQMVEKYPNQVTIITEGSMTNVAMAVLNEPGIASKVNEIIHMGGSFAIRDQDEWSTVGTPDIPGYVWRSILKFNTEFDPEATEIVIRSGIPVTFVPGEVTSRVFQRMEDIERVKAIPTPFHQHLYLYGKPWVEWSVKERKLPGAHMHDPLTLSTVIDRTFCKFVKMHCDLDRFRKFNYPFLVMDDAQPQCSVAVDVDAKRFEAWLADRLASPLQ